MRRAKMKGSSGKDRRKKLTVFVGSLQTRTGVYMKTTSSLIQEAIGLKGIEKIGEDHSYVTHL